MGQVPRPTIAPFLAGWYLTMLQLATRNTTFADPHDLYGSLVVATFVAWLCWRVAAFLYGNRGVRALAAVYLVAWLMAYGTLSPLALDWLSDAPHAAVIVLAAWFALLAAALAALRHLHQISDGTVRGLSAGLTLLTVMATVGYIRPLLITTTTPPAISPGVAVGRSADSLPDIYIILLDKLGSARTLAEIYGVSYASVVDSLQRLGFVVPRDARTNYIHTQLVLATFLNGQYVHEAVADSSDPWNASRQLVENAGIWGLLKSNGYQFVFFPTGFPTTSRNAHADINLTPPLTSSGGIARTWFLNSPLPAVRESWCRIVACRKPNTFPYRIEGAAAVQWKLEALVKLTDLENPTVAFLHLLVPHEPYILNADCSAREPFWPTSDVSGDLAASRQAYADQSECVASLILDTMTRLLARSDRPPIIILQSDHGHGHISVDPVRGITLPLGSVDESQVAERLEVFAAYYFPGADSVVYDSISPVNVLPLVLKTILDTNISLQADRSYWSTFRDPFTLVEVEPPSQRSSPPPDTASKSATTPTAPSGNR